MIRARMTSGVVVVLGWVVITAGAAAPVAAQAISFVPVGSITGPADLVKVQGGYAYLAGEKTITVVDISNPAAPKRAGAYTFPEKIWGFRVVGSLVYVAADFFGLGILDVSNAAAPTLVGRFKTPGQAKAVVVSGTRALVADHMSGLDFLDVSNQAKPASLGSFFLEGYARDVALSGTLAYAVDSPTGLYVLDFSKKDPLEAVGTLQSASGRVIDVPESSSGTGPKVACVVGGAALQVFDVSNPAAPVLASTFRTPGRPQRVAIKGALAYVADGKEGLQVVDLSTPSAPRIVGAYKTTSLARDVAVTDSLVFVIDGSGEGNGDVLILRQAP